MERSVQRTYQQWYDGDGLTIEFALPKELIRPNDLTVLVQGLAQRATDQTGVHDYEVRGFRPSYPGQKNRVRFTVAPPAGSNVGFLINAS